MAASSFICSLISSTPSDFFDYLSKQIHTNANGQKISAYQKDLEAISDDDYLNNELMNKRRK